MIEILSITIDRHPTSRGGKWHNRTVKHILENPIYKGTAHYKGNKVKNKELASV